MSKQLTIFDAINGYTEAPPSVPFVDVLTTMSDESIPLTTFEYKEWGNPKKKKEYCYIKKYSPYDNIDKKPYPQKQEKILL